MRPLSVIIPFYEKQKTLKNTWRQLTVQTEEIDEVIIVDDHSPNGIGVSFPSNIKIIKPKKLQKHVYRLNTLRNHGIKEAKNDAVIILDPDCIPNPTFLENARKIYDPSVLFAGVIDFVNEDGSVMVDPRLKRTDKWMDRGITSTWGGCMMFSKARASLIGWYSPEYDGSYGPDDSDFGYKCFHSGMRVRLSEELRVLHQYHPARRNGKIERDESIMKKRELFFKRREQYGKYLHLLTAYSPAVAVLVISMLRPHLIDQCLRAVFRNIIPLKVFLVNQGDRSNEQARAVAPWKKRWAVDYILHKPAKTPAITKTEAMERAKKKGYKYLIILDDDMTVMGDAVVTLVNAAEAHPEFHAISGWYHIARRKIPACGGGYITPKRNHQHWLLPVTKGVHEVDFIGTGWCIMRLEPLVPFDLEYETGWNDWDWSWEVKSRGLRLAVCGDAGAYHKYLFTPKGVEYAEDPLSYGRIRRNFERHDRMADRFESKWGYRPRNSLMWKGALRK